MSIAPVRPRDAEGPMEFRVTPPGAEDFRDPIAFIAAEHERQLALCELLGRLVRNPRHGAEPDAIAAAHDYLRRDFAFHVADEEADLFPLLKRRCPAGDDVTEIFALLRREHETDARLTAEVAAHLERLVAGRALGDPARYLTSLCGFCETQCRHLAWENVVILPRARAYLSAADKRELGRRMAARRGFELPLKRGVRAP